jgi:hypothetical protein
MRELVDVVCWVHKRNHNLEVIMTWFKKHVDLVVIVGLLLTGFGWFNHRLERLEDRLSMLESEVTQIKTVLIIRGMMPESMAVGE